MRNRIAIALGILSLAPMAGWAQTLTPSQDTFYVPGNGTNYGTATTVTVGSSLSVGLVQFDLGTLPAGVTAGQIQKATLTLFLDRVGSGGSVNVNAVASPWGEQSVTGFAPPASGSLVASNVVTTVANTFISVDATAVVQGWVTTPGSNNGFMISGNAGTSVQFDSKENLNTSHPAVLTIVLASAGEAGPTGPAGPAGPAGATGAMGPAGATGAAGAAGANGSNGTNGAGYTATSATSRAIGTGSTTFVTQAGLAYTAGALSYATVCSAGTPAACFFGNITSYSGTSLTINATSISGSGTFADWQISVAGPAGATGVAGATGPTGPAGTNGSTGPAGPTGPTGVAGATGPAGSDGTGAAPLAIPLSINGHNTGAAVTYFAPTSAVQNNASVQAIETVFAPASCKPSMTVTSYVGVAETWNIDSVTPTNGATTWAANQVLATCNTNTTAGNQCTATAASNVAAGTVLTIVNPNTGSAGGVIIAFSCK